jgi:hypothetical protein
VTGNIATVFLNAVADASNAEIANLLMRGNEVLCEQFANFGV